MPPERVPDPLRQKFLPHDSGYQLEYSKYLDIRKGSDCNVKFFRNCSGEFVNCIALHCANCVVLCRPSGDRSETRYVFPEELTVKDIEYIRCEDGGYGFVVALNSTRLSVHPHCVALLRWNGAQLQLVRKLKMDQEITCLKVVADDESMIHLSPLLHPKMISWPHIVAVGTRYAHCYLFHFDQLQQQQRDDVHVPLSGTLTDGLKSFHDGDTFVYTVDGDCTGNTQSKRLSRELVYVSYISFMERSRTVLVGFSFGGIMSISLSTCPRIDPLIYPCSAPVQFITPVEPDDDPRAQLWFFVAYGATITKPLHLCLFQVLFPEEESHPLSERTWDRPFFVIKLVIPFHSSSRWVSLQTLVRERVETRSPDDSNRDSFRLGPEKDKSLVFFTYVACDTNGCCLKGGLFDLNAYYYERMVGSVVHDGTAAQQCAFMSLVHPIPMHLKDEDFSLVKDSIVDTSLITRFISNVSDAEQMFYPSALEIFSIYVAGTKKCFQFTLPSLPNQLLSAICANLELHVADAKPASTWLSALGFYKKEIYSAKDQYGHLCSVLSVLISHQRAGAIVQFIKHCESPESRHMIATWIWEEIDKASKKLHETIAPLFARFSAPLSPAGRKSLAHVHDVFVAGMQIIRHLVASGDREQDETKEYMTSLEAQLFAVENLFSYSTVIHQLIYSKILPVAEDREIRLAMEKSLKERRSKIPGRQLNVDKLVTRMRKRSPSEPLWHAEGPQWYPPALLNLLGPILLLNIPTLWKGQLLAFYLLDYANCTIACTAGSGLAENIADLVTRQMNGILSMKKDEVQNVYKMWCADCGNLILERSSKQSSPCSKELSMSSEAKRLMSIPRTLSVVEEKELKSILDSVPFGKFHWQCYLARNRRYDEMSELPIPLNAEHDEGVLEYLQLLPAIKMLRKSDICSSMKSVNQPAWPANIKQAIEKFENERCLHSSYESELPVLNHGKTPVPLKSSKINTNGWIGTSGADQHFNKSFPSRTSEPSDASPSRKSSELNSSEDDLLFSRNISINTLNNITDILRTPRALACAAAQAESQRKWIDTTPEGELRTAAPRSILKSGKWDRGTSPSRTRLHFDLPSSNSSLNISENFENITQPNFDESFEYYGKDERMDMTEEFIPRVSPDHYHSEGTNDVLQKSLEIQDEDEEEGGDHGRGTVEIEEMGVTTEQFVPLVSSDLEHHNQSLMATDKEFQTTNSVLQSTNGVLQKSFEIQDEDEDEGGDYGRNTVQVEQQNEDDFGNIAANPSEIYFEEQEEEEEIPQQGDGVTLGGSYDRQRDHGSSALEEKDLRTSIEIQEESYEVDTAAPVRKPALSAKVEFGANSKSGDRIEGPMISQLEKQVEFDIEDGKPVQEISEDTTVESSARSNSVAENVSVATESATTCVIPNFTLEISHVKLVDYSFSNSTFETNSASRTLKKALDVYVDADNDRDSLQSSVDGQHDVDRDTAGSVKKTSAANESSDPLCCVSVTLDVPLTMLNRMDSPTATTDTGNSVGVCASLQSEEAHSSNTSTARKQVSLKKTGRLSGTPTRHSLRLRERVVEPVGKETEDDDVLNSNSSQLSPSGKHDASGVKTLTTPPRKRTRTDSSASGGTDNSVVLSTRRSPARKRRNVEVTQSTILELPTPNPMVAVDEESDADATGTHRVLRRRTPTRAGQERLPTPASKTSRTTRKTSDHGKAHLNLQPKAGDESSRRTPTRSMSKSKMNNSPSTSRRSSCTSNAVKELQDTSAIPALGGLDARSFFNMVTERKMAEIESSRRRTLSDSGILDLQSNSGQVKVLDAIPEVEEEPRSRRSRSRMKENDDIGASTSNKEKTPSRPRRATSASILEETPPRITRTHSERITDSLRTPRSSQRKRQTHQLSQIPE